MGYVQLVLAVLSFAKELFKYLNAQDEQNKTCATKVKDVADAIKTARKSKDTSGLESAFAGLGFADPFGSKLQDKST